LVVAWRGSDISEDQVFTLYWTSSPTHNFYDFQAHMGSRSDGTLIFDRFKV